jgi:pilus assembly protein Flp/PilA
MLQSIKAFAQDDSGVTMLEYTILLGIITVAVITSVAYAGGWVSTQWKGLTAKLT